MADENSDLDNLSPAELERMKNELTRELMIETANSGIDFVPFVNSANRFAQGHIVMGFVNLGTSVGHNIFEFLIDMMVKSSCS